MAGQEEWVRPERGSAVLARLLIWVTLRLGLRAGRLVLPLVTAYFLLVERRARRASRMYLGRVLGRTVRWRDVGRHFHRFATTTLDRVFFLTRRDAGFSVEVSGIEALRENLAGGRGCILIGAHLGSFEALRAVGRDSPLTVKVLMYRRNAGGPTRLLERLAPDVAANVIDIGEPGAMLRVQDCLARGEVVGMLGDRAPQGERCCRVRFLGGEVSFPVGPLLVAHLLRAPVMLFYGIRMGPERYRVGFERFAQEVQVRRGYREEDLKLWVQRYADRVGELCRLYPFDWFNFHDLWGDAGV